MQKTHIGGKITAAAGPVTIRLRDGSSLTGTATVSADTSIEHVTITAAGTTWTVPTHEIVAVGVTTP